MKRSVALGSLVTCVLVVACGGGVAPVGDAQPGASSGASGGAGAGSSGASGSGGSSGGASSGGASSGGASSGGASSGGASSGGTSGGSSGASSGGASSSGSSGTSGPTTFTATPADLSLGSTGSAGGAPASYKASQDATTTIDGASSELLAAAPGTSQTAWAQTSGYRAIDASYWGKRWRMRVKVKTESAYAGYVYFEIDALPASYVIDNLMIPTDRSIKGTTDWSEIALVLDVPPQSVDFAFGSGLIGDGKIWIGPITFEEVPTTVPTTPHGFGGSSP